jgi:restriction system protein
MLPVLATAANGPTSVPDAEARIATEFDLTEEERTALLPSGKQRVLHNRVHWAKFYLTKAGLLAAPKRGIFTLTDLGREVLASPPLKLDTKHLLKFQSFATFYRANQSTATSAPEDARETPTATPEEVVEEAHRAVHAALQAELLERIQQNDPAFFEQLIIDLMVAMGYGGSHRDAAERLGKSGDGGVDGVINEDVLGLDRIYIQAKRYASAISVGRPDVQAFTGSLVGLGASKGIFVTTSGFSAQATQFAAHLPHRVILIDGQRLTELMIQHGVGVRVSRALEFKRLDEDYFSNE